MKVKVSEAKGQVLDYLVAQAMGKKIYRRFVREMDDCKLRRV
jgi:hypothetical protein